VVAAEVVAAEVVKSEVVESEVVESELAEPELAEVVGVVGSVGPVVAVGSVELVDPPGSSFGGLGHAPSESARYKARWRFMAAC